MTAEGSPTAGEGLPDTAMASGSDDGEPGENTQSTPRPGDAALLQDLEQPTSPPMDAVEDSPAAAHAVEDDSVLPVGTRDGDGADKLTPEFRAPPET